ncbi:UNVERIFIED_CONTAM: hypothetical protein Sindi_1400100 [Sesamum indicum]
MRLLDSCGIDKDITALVKESVQELESSLRTSRDETVMAHDIMAPRRKVYKRIKKCIKNMKGSKQLSPNAVLYKDQDLKTITCKLKETKAIGFSIFKSMMMLMSREKAISKPRGWSLVSKFMVKTHTFWDEPRKGSSRL